MNNPPVPEFMKRYMENIGADSFTDFDLLAHKYHSEINHYHSKVHPAKAEMAGLLSRIQGSRINFDSRNELYAIEERFKEKALETACKYGYVPPEKDNTLQDKALSQTQGKGAFNTVLGEDDLNRSPEDKRAYKAHASFETKNNITPEMKKYERDFIEMYYGAGVEQKQPDIPAPTKSVEEVKAEFDTSIPDKYRQQVKRFQLSKEDITQTDKDDKQLEKEDPKKTSRYLSSLSSEQEKSIGHEMGLIKDDLDKSPEMENY